MRAEDLACNEEIKAIFKDFNEEYNKKRIHFLNIIELKINKIQI